MAVTAEEVVVRLTADVAGYQAGMRSAGAEADKTKRKTDDVKRSAQGLGRASTAAFSPLVRGAGNADAAVGRLGSQMGDFTRTLASGGSAASAFTVTLSNMAGVLAGPLGMAVGALAGWGLNELVSRLGSTETSAEQAEAAFKSFSEAMVGFGTNAQIAGSDLEELREKFGAFAEDVRQFAAQRAQVDLRVGIDALQEAIAGPRSGVTDNLTTLISIQQERRERAAALDEWQQKVDDISASLAQMTGLEPDYYDLVDQLDVARNQVDLLRGFVDELNQRWDLFVGLIEDAGAELGLSADQMVRFETAMRAVDAAVVAGDVREIAAASGDALSLLLAYADEMETIPPELKEIIDNLGEVNTQTAAASTKTRELESAANGVSSALQAATADAAAMVTNLQAAANVLSAIGNAIEGLGIGNIGRRAQIAALEAGQDRYAAAAAAQIAQERARLAPALGSSEGPIREAARQQLAEYIAQTEEAADTTRRLAELMAEANKTVASGGVGGGAAPVARDLLLSAEEIRNLERELLLIGKTTEEIARHRAEWAMLDEAKRAGIPITADLADEIARQAEEVGRLTGELERAQTSQQEFEARMEDIAGAIADAIVSGESLRDSLAKVFQQIARDLIQSGVLSLLKQLGGAMAGGGGGGLLSMLFSADGNVVSGPGISAYSGQVVSKPTVFPFAKGIGLMGEAGPEAILPLTRIGGKLGVRAERGSDEGVGGRVDIILHAPEGFSAEQVGQVQGIAVQVVASTARRQSDQKYLSGGG